MVNDKMWKIKKNAAPYIFISPFYILFLIFMLYPVLFSLYISFSQWNGVGKMKFIGLKNYINAFHDKIFIQSIVNGVVIFFMYVPLMLLVALVIAVILNKELVKFKGVFRTIMYIPNITSVVAVSFVFLLAYDTNYGFINAFLIKIGLPAVSWFGSAIGARIALSSLVVWRWLGYNMILLLSGLQNISEDIYEAASIDGAGAVKSFFKITVPLMKPVILFCTVLSTIGTFSLFTEPMILTAGGPLNKTITPVLYIYNQTFSHLRMGYASSLSYIYFILMFAFTILQFKLTKSKDS